MFCICLEVEEGVVLLVLEGYHAWEVLTTVILALEAYDVTAEEAQGVYLNLLLAVSALLGIVFLLESNEVVGEFDQVEGIERRQHQKVIRDLIILHLLNKQIHYRPLIYIKSDTLSDTLHCLVGEGLA